MQRHRWISLIVLGASLFLFLNQFTMPVPLSDIEEDRVVIAAPVQLLLSGGDRYLAANLETIRSATSGQPIGELDAIYRVRAHSTVAQLNPCHEDNYYLGNALLTWGGAVDQGNDILRRAMQCRQWDYVPPFFYGFNQYYFYHNNNEARLAFEISAQRSPANYASLMKLSIMITAGEMEDDQLALDFLKHQRSQSSDAKLRQMLDKRIVRLEGLIKLRDAQKRYEQRYNKPLTSPEALLKYRLIEDFPIDPLGLGYVFQDGQFVLRQLRLSGMENQK